MKILDVGMFVVATMLGFSAGLAQAACKNFTGSTLEYGDGPKASWRTDYPLQNPRISDEERLAEYPWTAIDFERSPKKYMDAVLSKIKDNFRIDGDRLVGIGIEKWWISHWMDYGSSGRERRMGLTKERGPRKGDLADGSSEGFQVWAVGFYNEPGSFTFGEIFADPCDPFLPVRVRFPRDTVSMKFLVTDADPEEVTYLKGAPEFKALIDPTSDDGRPEDRVSKTVRLLQLDIAVKDRRARGPGWVFGTFGWVGPAKGDMLFDNLKHVSLQWGNDPGVYNREIRESWINEELDGVMYGWAERPTLGFNGRANGPADNIRSSCLSCHSAARAPRSTLGILGARFNIENDFTDPMRVIDHVETWFTNRSGSELFSPEEPAASVLDYSLQLDAATFRMCRACGAGDLTGDTPLVCRTTGFYNRPVCNEKMREAERLGTLSEPEMSLQKSMRMMAPPRQ